MMIILKIKRKLVSFFLIACTTFMGFGQEFNAGVLLGLTASQVDGDSYAGYNQPGLTGGLYVNRQLKNNLIGQLEFRYTEKGARETGAQDEVFLYQIKSRYFELPMKAIFEVPKYKATVELGISNAYLIGVKEEGSDGQAQLQNFRSEDDFRSYELSFLGGLSYNISRALKINIEYNYSINTIRKYANTVYRYGPIARALRLVNGEYNNAFRFTFYYQFGKSE